MQPIVLEPNMPETFYRGAGRIRRFRGAEADIPDRPEDWMASTTARFGHGIDGMTRLADGLLLADAIASDPVAWLGTEHVARHGADPALLVKLLDTGQRLPVHVHPNQAFAAEHLASRHGKTEAWIVLEAEPGAAMYLGFRRDVDSGELAQWVRDQDAGSLLATTNRVPVSAGDGLLCPAGTPHAIGEGVLLAELQEPTDLSILLEWRDFPVGADDATLGLTWDEALGCVTRQALPAERLDELRGRRLDHATGSLLPAAADSFFVAERVDSQVSSDLPAAYGLLIVTGGAGMLTTQAGAQVPVRRGSTVLVPHGAGTCTLSGDLQAIRCLPPA